MLKDKTNSDVYLEWLNNWLTVARMADHYNMDRNELQAIIFKGEAEFNRMKVPDWLTERLFKITNNGDQKFAHFHSFVLPLNECMKFKSFEDLTKWYNKQKSCFGVEL